LYLLYLTLQFVFKTVEKEANHNSQIEIKMAAENMSSSIDRS